MLKKLKYSMLIIAAKTKLSMTFLCSIYFQIFEFICIIIVWVYKFSALRTSTNSWCTEGICTKL